MLETLKKELEALKQNKERALKQVKEWEAQVIASNGGIQTLEKLIKAEEEKLAKEPKSAEEGK